MSVSKTPKAVTLIIYVSSFASFFQQISPHIKKPLMSKVYLRKFPPCIRFSFPVALHPAFEFSRRSRPEREKWRNLFARYNFRFTPNLFTKHKKKFSAELTWSGLEPVAKLDCNLSLFGFFFSRETFHERVLCAVGEDELSRAVYI